MKTAVIFDLDGTLLDTLEDLLDASNHALTECGFPKRTLPELRAVVGNGAANQGGGAVSLKRQHFNGRKRFKKSQSGR